MRTPSYCVLLVIGLWACGSSDNTPASAANLPPDASPSGGSGGSPGLRSDAADAYDEPLAHDAELSATEAGRDASRASDSGIDVGRDASRASDSATLEADRDSQDDLSQSADSGRVDRGGFACNGSVSVSVTCAAGTYCSIHWTHGELPMPTATCEPLTALPCFMTNAGCSCQDLPREADASACQCSTGDAAFELTLECH